MAVVRSLLDEAPSRGHVPQLRRLLPPSGEWRRHRRRTRQAAKDQQERLKRHPLFASCPPSELRTLQRWGDEVSVPPGVELLRENAIGTCLIAVLSGRLTATEGDRHRRTIGTGEWVGDSAVLGFGPQPATVVTASECVLFALSPRAVLSFALTLPGLRRGLFPGLTESQARYRVQERRREGLAQWRQLRSPVPATPAARPAWLRQYPSRVLPLPVPRRTRRPVPFRPGLSEEQRRRRAIAMWCGAVLSLAGCSLAFVLAPIPYYSLQGGMRSATAVVRVSGASTYPPRGEVLFPVVMRHHSTALAAVRDWVDGVEVLSRNEVFGDASPKAADRVNLQLMNEAKRSAAAAGLTFVGRRVGAARVTIPTGRLGGPSGGLAFSLALIDVLTPGELTGGNEVAATGTMADDGKVGRVGDVRLKTLAARAAGARVLLVPPDNYREAAANAGPMRVIAVGDLRSAVRALGEL